VKPSLYHSYESIQTLFILVTNLKSFPFLFSCSLYFNKAIELSSLCFNKTQLYLVLRLSTCMVSKLQSIYGSYIFF
ncbi:unnamed protein product, partial [Brassica oleracea]